MRLHQYPELFSETLRAAADHLHIKLEFVESVRFGRKHSAKG